MDVNSTRYTLVGSRQPIGGRNKWIHFLFPEIALVIMSIILIACLVIISPNISIHYLQMPIRASLYSLSGSIPGVILFMLIEGLLVIVFIRVLRLRWSRPMLLITFLLIVFGCLLIANSIPVVMYAEIVDENLLEGQNWPVQFGMAIALLTANGMLLFFTHTIFTNIWNELKQNYVRAGMFRGEKNLSTLNEKITWIYYSQITPVFYFIFSFTLFTDIVFQNQTDEQGIVKTLFNEVTQKGLDAENLGRVAIWAFTMLATVLFVRIITSLPLRSWEAKHGVLPQ